MNLSKFFIDRPIFAGVISVLMVLAGLLAVRGLPISEYPEVVVKISSALTESSIVTWRNVRFSGSIVVFQSCSGFISPRPLYRWIASPFLPSSST